MPGWVGLLEGLLERVIESGRTGVDDSRIPICRDAISSGRFDLAGSILKDMLLPADFDEVIQQKFGNKRLLNASSEQRQAQLRRLHFLTQGPWAGIVTTNYDFLIETSLSELAVQTAGQRVSDDHEPRFNDREVAIVQGDDSRLGTILARPPVGGFFVKVHGSISGECIVLSTEDYGRAYLGTPRITSFFVALMLRYHLVFIGCSLEDEVLRLRRKLVIDFHRMIPSAYALLPSTKENRQRVGWLRDHALIESVLYDFSDGRHEYVEAFLEEASRCADWATQREARPAASRKLAAMTLAERLGSIGEINLRLLRLITFQPDRAIEHASLVELDRSGHRDVDPVLYRLSAEERVYRVLFLVGIRLVVEDAVDGSFPRYRVPTEIAEMLSTQPVSAKGPRAPGPRAKPRTGRALS